MISGSDMLTFFADLIEKETGIRYTETNAPLLKNRLEDLAKIFGVKDAEAFWNEIKIRGLTVRERAMVLDLATNNETSFFRDKEVFDFFRTEFITAFANAQHPIRIWCTASSTGQEPYSLAMVLALLKDAGTERRYEILATDYSDRVLAQARSGIYSELEVQRGLSPDLLARFFIKDDAPDSSLARFRVKPDLGQFIRFHKQNLIEPWSHTGPFDIIFCRNVLIYQDVPSKKKIIARMAECLVPDGYLVLGGAESLIGLSEDFEMVLLGRICLYKRKKSIAVRSAM